MAWLDQFFGLEGRTAVVTGGARGLGKAMATALALAGAELSIWDLNGEEAAYTSRAISAESGKSCTSVQVDVRDEASVRSALAQTLDEKGRVHILVNSAGISHNDDAADIPLETWQRVLDINLTGTLLCCREVGAHMKDNGGGSIVNMASIMAVVSIGQKIAYSASKGGVGQLTKTLAVEWAKSNVRVNALAPSPFESPMLDYAMDANPELFELMWSISPFGRPGRTEEIMGPAVFLASDASSMVTGHILAVDGGYLAR